jgi:hypothetical protein
MRLLQAYTILLPYGNIYGSSKRNEIKWLIRLVLEGGPVGKLKHRID